jgi:predicted DNA-binding transcriptional regulator AlpA
MSSDFDRLWTVDDIADFLSLSSSSVRQRIVTKPNFPKPIHPVNSRTRRWIPPEVKTWALTERNNDT